MINWYVSVLVETLTSDHRGQDVRTPHSLTVQVCAVLGALECKENEPKLRDIA